MKTALLAAFALLLIITTAGLAKPVRSGYDCVVKFKDSHEVPLKDVYLFSWATASLNFKLTDGSMVDVPFDKIDRIYVLNKSGQYTRHIKVLLLKGTELQGSVERGIDTAAEGEDENGLVRKIDASLIEFIRVVHSGSAG